MPPNLIDLDHLLDCEREELTDLYVRWQSARDNKEWHDADKLREELLQWQTDLGWIELGQWHPAAEPPEHRALRYNLRRNATAHKPQTER